MDEDAADLKALTDDEIKEEMQKVSQWNYQDNKISKELVFNSFSDVISFINELTPFFNRIDHHPDICIYYKKAVFTLTRYSIGGKVTSRDFMVASEIDKTYSNFQPSH